VRRCGVLHRRVAARTHRENPRPSPFVVRVRLDDAELVGRLPAGSTGDAAIYTEHVKVAHVIRKVLLRQIAITNYVNPF
jgi:hypothetical protein